MFFLSGYYSLAKPLQAWGESPAWNHQESREPLGITAEDSAQMLWFDPANREVKKCSSQFSVFEKSRVDSDENFEMSMLVSEIYEYR